MPYTIKRQNIILGAGSLVVLDMAIASYYGFTSHDSIKTLLILMAIKPILAIAKRKIQKIDFQEQSQRRQEAEKYLAKIR